jgi:hypothetical protein
MDATSPLRSSEALVRTSAPGRYLQQLCKHFQHKLPVTHDERWGRIAFSMGDCRLEAGEGVLRLTVTAPGDARVAQLQDVVARHLVRFAFREDIQVDWRPA